MSDEFLDVLQAFGLKTNEILQPLSLRKGKEKRPIKKTQKALSFIDNYFESLVTKSEEEIPILYTYSINDSTPVLHEINFACYKMDRLQMKIQSLTQSFYTRAATAISQLGAFLSENLKLHKYYRCYYKRLPQMVENLYYSNEHITKLKRHILCLDNYLKRRSNTIKRFPVVTNAQLDNELQNSLQYSNSANEYCRITPFDTYFDLYVFEEDDNNFYEAALDILHSKIKTNASSRRDSFHLPKAMSKSRSSDLHEIKEKLQQSPFENQYSLNLMPITDLISEICEKLQIKNSDKNFYAEYLVIKCSVMRIVYDRIYSIMPEILKEQTDFAARISFEKKCSVIRDVTPRILRISTSVINPDLIDYPFTSLAIMSEDLQAASMNLQLIQFFTNPLDIINSIYQAIKCIERFVENCSEETKFGHFLKNKEKKKIPQVNTMSFDDFFSLFWPVFTLNPIPNCQTVATLLMSMTNYTLASPFDFAKLLYISAVEYTQTVNLKELIPQHFIDQSPKDPLDLSIV